MRSLFFLMLFCVGVSGVFSIGAGSDSLAEVIKKAEGSVVKVVSFATVAGHFHAFRYFDDSLHSYASSPGAMDRLVRGLGSGFIFDAAGKVLTSSQLVHNSDLIEITLKDNRRFKARVVGEDPQGDLAVLEIDDAAFSGKLDGSFVADLGNTNGLQVGDEVLAIGFPLESGHHVARGVVLSKNRTVDLEYGSPYDGFIEIDASISPEGSGGPLLDAKGKIIGIATAVYPWRHGLSFALSINLAKRISADIIKHGSPKQSWLGIYGESIDLDQAFNLKLDLPRGVYVRGAIPEGPASLAGVTEGDIIVKVNGARVENSQMLSMRLQEISVGDTAKLSIIRKGKKTSLNVVVREAGKDKTGAKFLPTE
jgi:S1-C subfamily serine protease